MDNEVRGSEQGRRLEEQRAEQAAAEARTEIPVEPDWDTRRTDAASHSTGYAHRVAYDPGPSGTAVAGLIIGLIAMAVALYSAFAPRQVVREGSEAVTTAWEQTVEGTRQAEPSSVSGQAGSSQSGTAPQAGISDRAAEELRQEVEALKRDLQQLRDDLAQRQTSGSAPER